MPFRNTLTGLMASLIVLGASALHAQDFPNKPVTLIAPFPAGSVTDTVTRTVAQGLQEILGQSVVVENRAGAQGTVGAAYVARSKPDGYTLLMASSGMFVAKSFYKTLSYEPTDGFQPVAGVGSTAMMFMVPESSPIKTIDDLTRAARADGKNISIAFGSPSGQLALSLYSSAAKVNPVPVSYRGIPQALTDLLGGHVKVAIVDVGNGVAQINSGKMRSLAISAQARTPAAPSVPTLEEAFPNVGVSLETIIAIIGPAGMPPAVVEKLSSATQAVLARPDVKARFASLNTAMLPLATPQLVQRIKGDNPKWEALIKRAGIEPE
jgi:tripartite-type tricarboxylate transporter receptor subunit TctC